jgi:hypothetical protein
MRDLHRVLEAVSALSAAELAIVSAVASWLASREPQPTLVDAATVKPKRGRPPSRKRGRTRAPKSQSNGADAADPHHLSVTQRERLAFVLQHTAANELRHRVGIALDVVQQAIDGAEFAPAIIARLASFAEAG